MPSDDQRQIKRGRTGIQNTGNTCFLASALQCLSHVPEFSRQLIGYEGDRANNEAKDMYHMTHNMNNAFNALWSGKENSISPKTILDSVATIAPSLADGDQHDAHELLSYVLDGIQEELNKSSAKDSYTTTNYDAANDDNANQAWIEFMERNKTALTNILYGQYCTEITCQNCQHTVTNYEPFEFLHLPLIQDKISVTVNVIDQFTITNETEDFTFSLKNTQETFEVEKDDSINKLVGLLNERRNTPDCDYYFLERKEDKKNFIRYFKVNKQFKNNFYFNTTSSEKPRCILAYPIPKGVSETAQPMFLLNTYCINSQGGRSLSMPQSLGVPFLIMCEANETTGILGDKIVGTLTNIAHYITENTQLGVNTDVDIYSIYLISNNVYNKGISNFNKYCDLMNEENPPDSDITWNNDTLLNTLFTDKSDEVRFAAAIWELVERPSSGSDAIPPNEVICKGIDQVCSVNLKAFAEYASEEELAAKNDNKKISLKDCLDLFAQPSLISEQPIWKCNNCGKNVFAENKYHFWRLPPVLIIHLKRFEYIPMSFSPLPNSRVNTDLGKRKINTFVDFPVHNLDLTDYLADSVRAEYKPENSTYDLVAVSNHNGDANFGHYNAYCKDNNEGEEKWFDYNDSRLTSLKEDKVCSKFGYILFYRRKDCENFTTEDLIKEMKAYEDKAPEIPFTKVYPYPVCTEEGEEEPIVIETPVEAPTVEAPAAEVPAAEVPAVEAPTSETSSITPAVAATAVAATAVVATAVTVAAVEAQSKEEPMNEDEPVIIDDESDKPIVVETVPEESHVVATESIEQNQDREDLPILVEEKNDEPISTSPAVAPAQSDPQEALDTYRQSLNYVQEKINNGENAFAIDDFNVNEIPEQHEVVQSEVTQPETEPVQPYEVPVIIDEKPEELPAVVEEQKEPSIDGRVEIAVDEDTLPHAEPVKVESPIVVVNNENDEMNSPPVDHINVVIDEAIPLEPETMDDQEKKMTPVAKSVDNKKDTNKPTTVATKPAKVQKKVAKNDKKKVFNILTPILSISMILLIVLVVIVLLYTFVLA